MLQTQNVKVYILSSILEELKAVGDKAAAAYQFAKNLCEVIDDSSLSGDIPSEKMIQLLGMSHNIYRDTFY